MAWPRGDGVRGALIAGIFLSAAMLSFAAPAPASAQEDSPVTLTAIPPEDQQADHESVVLSARLEADDGPLRGLPVTFYIVTNVFGERLMKVGEALADANGVASVVYRPTWEGDHAAVAHFSATAGYSSAETSFHFDATEAEPAYEPAEFGLSPVRQVLPVAVAIAVLAVCASVVWALVDTVRGIRAAARVPAAPVLTEGPGIPAFRPPGARATAGPKLFALLVAGLVLLTGVPLVWLAVSVSDDGRPELLIGDGDIPGHDANPPGWPLFPATLERSVKTVVLDATGQPAPGSITLPADLAITAGRIRILDSIGGRVVTVAPDGELIPIQQGVGEDGTSLKGSRAMAALGERLFVVAGDGTRIVVVNESGLIEGSIVPALPPAGNTPVINGIAVSGTGRIWISDAANHRVLLLNGRGEFELVIGAGAPSSGDEGLDTPTGMAVDHDGNLYVSDTGNHVVRKYSPLGVLLEIIGDGRLETPNGITVDSSGRVFVVDTVARQICVFSADGSYLGVVRNPAFEEPQIVRAKDNGFYLLDSLAGMMEFGFAEPGVGGP
jgi:sugar lactone lactonase YvrE